ncbi:hypothetical protein XELAEV_18028201mg [Xenopus laevis]|uniref:ShKT domain-containing protein n=1 Tax=Xenopus laevis TaxID=8355 RepID=A0A974CXR0_XENLA|nr:hypothetical protein XELAEV_18028201mg [Xenopus laevis]
MRLYRSIGGRPVDIKQENIKKMKTVSFSALSTKNKKIQDIIVNTHNILRSSVDPPATNMLKMHWNKEAAKTAEKWAKLCLQNHSPKEIRVTSKFRCGENLYFSTFKTAWEDVINAFFSEREDFVYGKGGKRPGLEIGHYTQLMWYRTHQIGCYVHKCPQSLYRYSYVCHYCPAGNTGNLKVPYKAGLRCADCRGSCDKGLCSKYSAACESVDKHKCMCKANSCPYQDKFKNCEEFNVDGACAKDKALKYDCPATCLCTNKQIK